MIPGIDNNSGPTGKTSAIAWFMGSASTGVALLAISIAAAMVAAACGGITAADTQKPLRVVATTALLADLVQNVAGGGTTVRAVIPPGADVHSFQTTPSDSIEMSEAEQKLWGIEQLNVARSDVPAITHVDYSARVQTVSHETNPDYHDLLKAFEEATGYGIIVNTSFNVRGEPIVCTPRDAHTCFMRTEMDYLVLGSYLLSKADQPDWTEEVDWREEFQLD